MAAFDSRVFVLPESEVCNYFIWRQKDWTRNSLSLLTRHYYSASECHGKNSSVMHEMLHKKGENWNNLLTWQKRGRCLRTETYESNGAQRSRWVVDNEIPIFSQNRSYIEDLLRVEEEPASVERAAS